MIRVTRLNGVSFLVNAELIEQVEATPDTVITLTTGNNIIVREKVDDVERLVIAYRSAIASGRTNRVEQAAERK